MPSFAFVARLALLHECCNALPVILREPGLALQVALEVELGIERIARRGVDRLLDQAVAFGGTLGERMGDGARFPHETLVVERFPDEAPALRLFGAEAIGEQRESHGARGADQPRQEIRAARVGHQAKLRERLHEARGACCEHDVASEGDVGAGACGDAVHRAHDRLRQRAQAPHQRVVVGAEADGKVDRRRLRAHLALGEILPGAESTAGAGEEDGPHARVVARLLQRVAQQLVHLRVERVQLVRTVEGERQDPCVARDQDRCHGKSLQSGGAESLFHRRHHTPIRAQGSQPMTYQLISLEKKGRVALITLNRPKQLNALSPELTAELRQALRAADADEGVGAIVITGNDKAFAAGADIAAMKDYSYMDAFMRDYITSWEHFRAVRKPVIAAVAGYALGGGCELAMHCDILIAADNAKFGQPEINLGIMPGYGGTQRLPRFTSKAKAMDLCLTARMMDAQEAERAGLVSRVVSLDKLMEEALAVAERIAGYSAPVVMMIKESINRAYETSLAEGVLFERRVFQSQFALEDQKEGMAAFLEKRKPSFKNR